jgi:hypothetical protein
MLPRAIQESKMPIVVDLEMTDTEYLERLTQGRNPVREQIYAQQLLGYGFSLTEAQRIAALFEKTDCSIAEKIAVNRALKQVWKHLTKLV